MGKSAVGQAAVAGERSVERGGAVVGTRGWRRHLPAALAGLVLGLLAIGPGLAPGFLLSYDMVFVPDPSFTRMTWGLTGTVPRHVPSDAFATALGTVIPADIAQKLILVSIFVMACVAAASLVPSERQLARLTAGVCYAWNPFVGERLIQGHWAFLLGYAALPWVVAAAAKADTPGGGTRLTRALVPAAIGGFAAIAISGLVAMVITGRNKRALFRTVASLTVLSLPWLAAGWLRPYGMPGDSHGVAAFAARADTPFGSLGSLLTLGGMWNREAVPSGYGEALTATAWLGVVSLALVAYGWRCRAPWSRGLGVAAVLGYVLAAVGVMTPGLLKAAIELWSGFAVLRDGQQYVAPLAVVVAVGLGLAVDRVLAKKDVAAAALAVFAMVAPVALLPGLAWGAAGRLSPVDYPADWARARRIIAADRTPGDVLVLPWATYRGYPWNHGRTVLDPLPRYLDRRVITSDAVVVGRTTVLPEGGRPPTPPGAPPALTVAAEDPRASALDPLVTSGRPLTEGLRRQGIRYVVVDSAEPPRERLAGAEPLLDGPDIALFRIPDPARITENSAPGWIVILSWIITIFATFWSFRATGTKVFPHGFAHGRRHPRKAP